MTRKVIHIWGICGIGGLLSKYMDKYFDYNSISIARKSHDVFKHSNEKTLVWNNKASIWSMRCALKARSFDIIHLHSGIQWLKYYRFFYPNKKIVLHLHGTEIRGLWDKKDLSKANMILVSTPDLLEGSPDEVLYLPNPIDEDLINYIKSCNIKKKKGIAFHSDRYASEVAMKYAKENNIDIYTLERDTNPLNHIDFLKIVAEYEYYIDVKRDFPNHLYGSLILEYSSLTGLEALALGCKVIKWNNEIIEGLPDKHKSLYIANLLNNYYNRLYD